MAVSGRQHDRRGLRKAWAMLRREGLFRLLQRVSSLPRFPRGLFFVGCVHVLRLERFNDRAVRRPLQCCDIRPGTEADIDALVACTRAARRRGGTPRTCPLGTAMQSALPRLLAGSTSPLTLFMARHGGEVVAGILLVAAGDRIIYEWGATSEAPGHRSLPLLHMLHWEAIQWARSAGFRWDDFGGYREDRGDSDPINRFKTGFSRTVQRLLLEHVRVRRPLAAGVLRTAVALHRLARR